MKLSFSTKGWNGYSFQEFCDMAQNIGFDGFEIYDINNDNFSDRYKDSRYPVWIQLRTLEEMTTQELLKR